MPALLGLRSGSKAYTGNGAYLDIKAAIYLQAHRGDLPPPEWNRKRQHLEDRADELLLRTTSPAGAANNRWISASLLPLPALVSPFPTFGHISGLCSCSERT